MKVPPIITIFITSLLLQGCVAAAIVGTAAIGTKAAIDPRTIGTQVDDNMLERRINSALSKDKEIKKKARINATIYQGKVLLAGQALNASLPLRAKQIAMKISGSKKVFNEVRLARPIGIGTSLLDAWITAKVRSKLLDSAQVKSSSVKVKTENSEVFLLGLVTEREGKVAGDIASRVTGVRHVTTAFTYIK